VANDNAGAWCAAGRMLFIRQGALLANFDLWTQSMMGDRKPSPWLNTGNMILANPETASDRTSGSDGHWEDWPRRFRLRLTDYWPRTFKTPVVNALLTGTWIGATSLMFFSLTSVHVM